MNVYNYVNQNIYELSNSTYIIIDIWKYVLLPYLNDKRQLMIDYINDNDYINDTKIIDELKLVVEPRIYKNKEKTEYYKNESEFESAIDNIYYHYISYDLWEVYINNDKIETEGIFSLAECDTTNHTFEYDYNENIWVERNAEYEYVKGENGENEEEFKECFPYGFDLVFFKR